MEEVSDIVHPGASRGVRLFAWAALIIIVGTMVAIIVAFFFAPESRLGEAGELQEDSPERPEELVVSELVDVTDQWGLAAWRNIGETPLRGGATLHDLDGDGDLDLLVAGGSLAVFEWTGAAFEPRPAIQVGDVISVFAGDVDQDGAVDVLVGTSDGASIVWGGSWFAPGSDRLELEVTGLVTAVIPLDLQAETTHILVLGYGSVEAEPDLILSLDGRAVSQTQALPDSERKSMVAEIADIDQDGLADIWVGRDVGWSSGADSLYSRQGDPNGNWVDIAPELGAASEVDAMGLTIADLTGDGRLDAYISDVGDNELLERTDAGFQKHTGLGVARIRPSFARDREISSSWASGAVDLNLDGRLDIVVANGGFAEISVPNKVVNTVIVEDDPPAILLGLDDGTFYDAWDELGLGWSGRSRGMSLGDIDSDGDTDVLIVDHEGGIHAFRNDVDVAGERFSASPGCLAAGSRVSFGDVTMLLHQQSFLGSHAPAVTAASDASIVEESLPHTLCGAAS